MKFLHYTSPGKWILTGEHAVIRGHSALVFPLFSRSLSLAAEVEEGEFGFEVHSENPGLAQATEDALSHSSLLLEEMGCPLPRAKLNLKVTSTIPVGAGLGSSAALSVALAKLFHDLGSLYSEQLFDFAHKLEDLFHGKSSGLDIAAVLAERPIRFTRGEAPQPLTLAWKPRLFLFDSGLRATTRSCVEQVIALKRPELDEQMGLATRLAEAALAAPEGEGISLLREALVLAQACYRQWDLIPPRLAEQIASTQHDGALACKITGSGGGGFYLGLFEGKAPASAIPCFL